MHSNTNPDNSTESDSQHSRYAGRDAATQTESKILEGPTVLGGATGQPERIQTVVQLNRSRETAFDGGFTLEIVEIEVRHDLEDGDEPGQLVATSADLSFQDDVDDTIRLWHLQAVAAANQAIEDAGLAPDHLLVLPEYVKGLYEGGGEPIAEPVEDVDDSFVWDPDPNYLPDGGRPFEPEGLIDDQEFQEYRDQVRSEGGEDDE